ncbi:MAG: 4-(cytidine 5'-diphospho)-2-C-methyl-D-erythritol kinase [Candidatus Zapsychrus exili]|nr:4-(cytidine 5'-diphospho)-2-C-methyl-D-erythritol kinase [Candidatus Zapsychrus exili]
MRSFNLKSPAKLNLFLKVLNKRPDGYHNISTIFERIDLCDYISMSLKEDKKISISCNHPFVPKGPKNLMYKCAKVLQEDFSLNKGVHIDIKKNIPVAAGLGGGSSNAATALLGLNKLWKLGLSSSQLLNYARKIGSDVPFFLHGITWGKGSKKGDVIKKININTKLYHILVVPRIKLYSGQVYGAFKLQLTKTKDNASILIRDLKKSNLSRINRLLINDLERSIFSLCPKLLKIKERLKSLGAKGVMVSGSGPCVFGIFESKKKAATAQSILNKRFSQVFIAKTL